MDDNAVSQIRFCLRTFHRSFLAVVPSDTEKSRVCHGEAHKRVKPGIDLNKGLAADQVRFILQQGTVGP